MSGQKFFKNLLRFMQCAALVGAISQFAQGNFTVSTGLLVLALSMERLIANLLYIGCKSNPELLKFSFELKNDGYSYISNAYQLFSIPCQSALKRIRGHENESDLETAHPSPRSLARE